MCTVRYIVLHALYFALSPVINGEVWFAYSKFITVVSVLFGEVIWINQH